MNQSAIGGCNRMFLVVLGGLVEGVDPTEFLRYFALDGPIVFPTRLESQPTNWRLGLSGDQHVPERRRNGFGRCRPVSQLRQRNEHIDRELLWVTIIGISVSGEMKI